MISDAVIKQCRYPPEKIPDSWFGTVPNLGFVSPPLLELKRFQPWHIIFTEQQLTALATVEAVHRYDERNIQWNTAAWLSVQPNAWWLRAKDKLEVNFYGLAPGILAYTTHYAVWALKATVADKLLMAPFPVPSQVLTPQELELCERYGVAKSVEKGVLPLPISYQIEREYNVIGEETHGVSVAPPAVPAVAAALESINPGPDEIVVLTKLAGDGTSAAADAVLIHIDRDDDTDHVRVYSFPLSPLIGGEIDCWIPATNEIRLSVDATLAPGATLFRYSFRRIRLNNILRARFGLVSRDEIPGETYDKVMAGVL